jgi:hypothetical protein
MNRVGRRSMSGIPCGTGHERLEPARIFAALLDFFRQLDEWHDRARRQT